MYGYRDDREWYDVQQVCLGGHVITNFAESDPSATRARCASCGEATITACPHCSSKLKGYHHNSGVISLGSDPDKFCDTCGEAMPWVQRNIDAVLEIAALSDALTETDQENLKDTVRALVTPSNRTEVEALRLRKILAKMDEFERAALLRALKSVGTDAAKEALGLNDPEPPRKGRR